MLHSGWLPLPLPLRRVCRLIPNCAVKHKRDTKWLVGDQMLPDEVLAPLKPGMPPGTPRHTVRVPKITDYSGLYVRRPHDRVSRWAGCGDVQEARGS